MSARIRKYRREFLLVFIGALSVYGLPFVSRLLPVENSDLFLRVSAVILFLDVLWYSLSGPRRFLPVMAVAALSLGLSTALYETSVPVAVVEASMNRGAAASGEGLPAAVYNLVIVGAALVLGCIGSFIIRRRRLHAPKPETADAGESR